MVVDGIGGLPGNGTQWAIPKAIPSKFLPDENAYAALCHRQTDHQAQIWVPSKDNQDSTLYIYSAVDTTGLNTRIFGIVSWVY